MEVQKEASVPREQCEDRTEKVCTTVPFMKCLDEPKEVCEEVEEPKCVTVEKQACTINPKEVCQDVDRKCARIVWRKYV